MMSVMYSAVFLRGAWHARDDAPDAAEVELAANGLTRAAAAEVKILAERLRAQRAAAEAPPSPVHARPRR